MRRAYRRGELDITDLDTDPVRQFMIWMNEAVLAGELEPNAMALATVGVLITALVTGVTRAVRFGLDRPAREK